MQRHGHDQQADGQPGHHTQGHSYYHTHPSVSTLAHLDGVSGTRSGPHPPAMQIHGSMSMTPMDSEPTAVLGAAASPFGASGAPGGVFGNSAHGMLLDARDMPGGEGMAAHHHMQPQHPPQQLQQSQQQPPQQNHRQQQLPHAEQHGQLQDQQQQQQQPSAQDVPDAASSSTGAGAPFGSTSSGAPKPIRRRMRMITSCLECRRRKLKCNKSNPCTNCLKFARECMYLGPKLDEASQHRLTEIKEKAGALERQLERDVARSTSRGFQQQRIVADDVEDEYDEERDLEITPMVALDLTYDDPDVDHTTDDIIDLGIQVGRMRITERIGGLNRPRISEEIQAGLPGGSGPPPPGFGPPPPQPPRADGMSQAAGADVSIPDFLRPGESYIPPTSGYFFGQLGEMPSLLSFIPGNKASGDWLMQRYFESVHPIARCVHRPSFEIQYATFWDDVHHGVEPRPSTQAVVFAAWFSAVVSLEERAILHQFGCTKAELMGRVKIGTESALSKANFLRTTRVETLQALVMYMIPLCRAEVSRAHSVLVGAAVRMAECMGLHRDGEAYGLTPLETHVRRLIWHQLCFLDVRTCEAQGPKPAIRREDYDTKLPINCEEDELTKAVVPPESAERWTSTLLPLMRFEINEMMRNIWMDRRRLEIRKTTVTAVLSKIENFRKRMLDKYERYLDDRVPIQRYAKLVMHLLMYRLYAMILHPYHSNTMNPMPPRLNSVLIWGGVGIVEISIQLETNPEFAAWAWYLGAYQQFQIALLLATEIYYRPQNKEGERIWACLDYVFNMDPNMSREDKGVLILREIASKTAVYMGMRKMRAPTNTTRAVPDKHAIKTEGSVSPPPAATAPPDSFNKGDASRGPQQQQHSHHHAQQPGLSAMQYQAHPGAQSGMMQQGQQHRQPSPGGLSPGSLKPEPNSSSPSSIMPQPMLAGGNDGTGRGHGLPPQMPTPMQMQMPSAGPPPNVVFAGVSNGEVLWSLPPQNADSPEGSSDGGSVVGYSQRHGGAAGPPGSGQQIDWSAYNEDINAIFPTDPQTGEFSLTGFMNPSLGMKWNS
ncbi:hypothetical protein RB597_004639 [Gaeumannomyces tritici]